MPDPTGETPTPPPSGETPQNPPGATPTAEEIAELRTALKRANAESADRRKKLDQLEADEKTRNEAQLSEVEKERKLRTAAETKLTQQAQAMRERAIRHAVEIEASRANFIDPADAIALADLSAIQYDDDAGTVSGADAVVKALAKAKPHLVKQATLAPNINGAAGGKGSMTSIDEAVARKRASGDYVPI